MTGLETLFTPLLTPFNQVDKYGQKVPCRGNYMCTVIELADEGFKFFCIYFCQEYGWTDFLYPGCLFVLGRNNRGE